MQTAAATAAQLLALLTLCLLYQQPSQALVWTQTFSTEMSTRRFFGFRLCNAPPSSSVVIDAVDAYNVTDMNAPDLVYSVRSRTTLNVIFCDRSTVDSTYTFVVAGMQETIQWKQICDNTLNLTIYLQSSVTTERQTILKPCNYKLQHANLTTQQVTAWLLLTYTADWDPVWLNRTLPELGDDNTTAFVMLSSSTDPMLNATWFRVQVNSELLGASMSPSQRVQAVLTSISTAPGYRWWLLICSVIGATENLLVNINGADNETMELRMDCSSLFHPTLVLGAEINTSNATLAAPAIESSTGGYWGPALQRLLEEQTFGGLDFCNATKADGAVLVTVVDDIVIGEDSDTATVTVVRSTVDLYVTPCTSSSSLTVGDAFLKVFLQREASWTEVCADSANPTVTVNMPNRTAFQFSPCPALENVTSDDSAAKLAWCILALNSSSLELLWTNRDTSSLVEPTAASVSFRILEDPVGKVLRWGNVQVNGLSDGDNADRLLQVFQSVNISYWPVVCQLLNPSLGSFMIIEIQSGLNSSLKFNLYANCSFETELSSTPPPSVSTPVTTGPATSKTTTPTTTSTTTPTITETTSTTNTPTATPTIPSTTNTPTATPTIASTTNTPTATPTTASTTNTPTATPTTASTTNTPTATPTIASTTNTPTATPTTASTTNTPTATSTIASTTATPTATPTTSTMTPSTASPSVSKSTAESGPVTLSELETRNKEEVQNAENRQKYGTELVVVVFALVILLLLSTLGICKLVAPRTV